MGKGKYRITVSVLAILLIPLLAVSGCRSAQVDGGLSDDYYEQTESEQFTEDYIDTQYESVSDEILDLSFQIDSNALDTFRSTVSGINVNYEKSENYGIDECLSAYTALKQYPIEKSENLIKGGQVDYQELLSTVKSNSSKNDDPYYYSIPSEIIEKAVEYITQTINYNIKNNPQINLNVLDYKLSRLKVLGYDDFGYAFYSQEDIALAINLEKGKYFAKDVDYEEIISHEANHIIQDAVITVDESLVTVIGPSYTFKDKELNAFCWTWYIEGAAQNSTLIEKGTPIKDSFLYESYLSALNTIMSAYAFNEDDVLKFQHLTSQTNIGALFDLFDCETPEQEKEILKMMAAIELYCNSNDTNFAATFYEKIQEDDTYVFGKKIRSPVGQTLSKIFYKNLAEKTKDKKVTLRDVFGLISVFEAQLNKEVWYGSIETAEYMGEFYKKYSLIQCDFFKLISQQLNISEEQLHKYYTNYHHTTDYNNLKNSLLTKEQNEFYQKIMQENYLRDLITVLEAQAVYSKN